ncbi:hypothetical protein V1514DRAFT_338447 [Lipomyces japonicus]|uniref:uncharacterized protein n=1 Tax=Lipomyces japonicus TaxID=56871 RepID=UPI0034CD7CC0
MPEYRLKVSASSSYDCSNAFEVPVNTETPVKVCSERATATIWVKVQDYAGFPDNSPSTNAYFGYADHASDLFAIQFSIVFNQDTSFDDVLFGNDFDRPIRDKLPYGFGIGYKIFNYVVDPSANGDFYAEKPYLYGYAVTSTNAMALAGNATKSDPYLRENVSGINPNDGINEIIPTAAAERRSFFLHAQNRQKFWFESGVEYKFDFSTKYIDMGGNKDYSIKMPGYSLNVIKYWDGQPLRYVLKNKKDDDLYFALVFELLEQ